jgi:uncharacterized protein YyaL (SSP411 family)
MLYDNAQLAHLYLWAGVEFHRPEFITMARSTLDYLERDLRHPAGGFFSSEDADSEGVEGKFYVWTSDEIRHVLGEGAERMIAYLGVTEEGNFEGSNILSIVGGEAPFDFVELKDRLLAARSARVRPGLDDKVIASWNGLAIRAFAEAGAAMGDERYIGLARAAARFTLDNLVVDGRLARSWRQGRTSVPGFLDDHAGMAVGLFTLYAATGEEHWYEAAISLVRGLDRFARSDGGFYSTSDDSRDLVKRPSDLTDNPLPSGNALAAEALLMAGLYTGSTKWRERSEAAIAAVALLAERYPSMVGHHLAVAHASLDTKELAIVGPQWRDLAPVYWSRYRPGVALAPSSTGQGAVPLLDGRAMGKGTWGFVCRGMVCDLPTSDPDVLAQQLST